MNLDLQNPDAHLAAVVDSSDDAIVTKNLDGIITSWNRSAERIFGFSAQDAIGQHITLIIPPERQDEEFVILGKIKAGLRVDHFETVRRTRKGDLVDISLTVSPIRDDSGKIIGAIKVARDIRDAKAAERLSAYLAAIVGSSDDAIVSKNLDGIITSWNRSAELMFGYTSDEAVGSHISLIIPPDLIDEEFTILGKVKSGLRVDHFQTLRQTKNGSLIDISLTVSPILDSRGHIIGASKVARNITDQNRTIRALEDANRRRDTFLATMSHELRTPLNAILGLSYVLIRSEPLSPKGQQYVTMIKESGDNLLSLINNVLDFSKVESGAMAIEAIDFCLPEMIEKVVVLQDAAMRAKGLEFNVHYRGALKDRYIGDPFRLQQILTNLLANAVKFTEKGRIELTVALRSQDEEGAQVAFEVADTGIGISAEKSGIIFEKFTQADASTTRVHGGSGLGLSICKGLAEAMKGTIGVDSRPGAGSTFVLTLPLGHVADARVMDNTPQADKRNILIVEDYSPNVIVLSSVLEDLGYTFDVARNGMEGCRRAQSGSYDVILMDVQMPGMDGFESTRCIRDIESQSGGRRTPIVAVTAHTFEKDRRKCLDAGMDDVLTKPLDPAQLKDLLNRYIASPVAA